MNRRLLIIVLAVISFAGVAVNAESTIYIFDNYPYKQMDGLSFNGEKIPLKEKEVLKEGESFTKYKKALTKITVKEEGRLLIMRDMTWAEKPYHDEITLDLADGDVYYIVLLSGLKSKMKILSENDGEKLVKKACDSKDWTVFPNIVYGN